VLSVPASSPVRPTTTRAALRHIPRPVRNWAFAISWTMLFSYPLMAVIQEISGRIGRNDRQRHCGEHTPALSELAAAGDCRPAVRSEHPQYRGRPGGDGRSVGAADRRASALLRRGVVGAVCGLLQIFMKYSRYVGVLKWLTLALFAYFGTVMAVKIPWSEAARGFLIPTLSSEPGLLDHGRRDPGARPSALICSSGRRRREAEDTKEDPQRKPLLAGTATRARCHRTHPPGYLYRNGIFERGMRSPS